MLGVSMMRNTLPPMAQATLEVPPAKAPALMTTLKSWATTVPSFFTPVLR